MTSQTPKIVVITPVKNESWILNRFLSVTSQFADYIIIADQNSIDGSIDICKQYPKVTLIPNKSEQYDEAYRQILLIQTARELVQEHKIILALDADEIVAANAMQTLGWQSMLNAEPGTILFFEKEDLYPTPDKYIKYPMLFPLGYVDDGATHTPSKIHSTRVPTPDYAPRFYIHDMKILHYTWLRPGNQAAKERMYSMQENIFGRTHLFNRRREYSSHNNHPLASETKNTPNEWFNKWESLGIDMKTIYTNKYYWQDYEVLKCFKEYGVKRFWLEPIWEFDWESYRLDAIKKGIKNIPDCQIATPPKLLSISLKLLDKLYISLRGLLRK